MRKSVQVLFFVFIMQYALSVLAYSQDTKGGTIKYEQHTYYDWNITPNSNQAGDNYLANLPTEKTMGMILYFDKNQSLYEQDMSVEISGVSERQQTMLLRMSNREAPRTEIKKVYFDLKKDRKIVMIELMTRYFLIEDKIVNRSWKPGNEQRKILDYLCKNATMKIGDQIITAWFTPNIPVSLGPEEYSGLPGLILAVEINGKNIFLATSVDVTVPKAENIVKPKEGSKISQKEFDVILAQKRAEWAATMKNRPAGGR